MQITVNIAPEVMNWVMQRVEVEKISMPLFNNIQQWKTGNKKPTFNQVEKLSKATNIPLGYFFLKNPPKEDLPILKCRTIDSLKSQNPSRNLIDTVHSMENIQEWMRNYLIASDSTKLDFIGSQKCNKSAHKIAATMHEYLGLAVDWFTHEQNVWESFKEIRTRAQSLGVIVMMNGIVENNTRRKLEIDEFRAFTLIDDYVPLIFINSNDSKNGKLFSLVHEMAHIWLGINNFFNDRYSMASNVSDTETLCNAIAGEFLVPQSLFTQKWKEQSEKNNIEKKISSLAYYFKCGMTVIARKALINTYIGKEEYNKLVQEAVIHFNENKNKSKNNETGGNYYNAMITKIDNRFLNALANSVQEGKTLYSDAFRLTNTNRNTFKALVEKVRDKKL
ncbi:MAG: ImmA/IrrE family metallo-endopeptidase [Clostridiales bacterium]|nr:ImmA/IrrE family metallo-endopeptidase [Clostridiales bacterium]